MLMRKLKNQSQNCYRSSQIPAWKFRLLKSKYEYDSKYKIQNFDTQKWKKKKNVLTFSWRIPLSCRNQSIDLQSKSMDWFLHDNGLRHERVKWEDSRNLKRKNRKCWYLAVIKILQYNCDQSQTNLLERMTMIGQMWQKSLFLCDLEMPRQTFVPMIIYLPY